MARRTIILLPLLAAACTTEFAAHAPAPQQSVSPSTTEAPAPEAPPQEPQLAASYEIKLHRPSKVGDQFHMDRRISHQSSTRNMTKQGAQVEAETIQARLEANVEVLDVDEHGTILAERYAVFRFESSRHRIKTKTHLGPGTVVTVRRTSKGAAVDVEGGSLAKEAERDLALVIALEMPAGPTLDDLYGTKTRQPAGAVWPIKAEAAARALSEAHHHPLSAEDVTGEVTFEGIMEEEGQECLALVIKVNAKARRPSASPPNFDLESARRRLELNVLLPTDSSKRGVTESARATLRAQLVGKNSYAGVQSEYLVDQTKLTTITPVEPLPTSPAQASDGDGQDQRNE